MGVNIVKIKELWKIRIFRMILGMTIGALIGFLYFHFWGCHGSCPIKNSPYKMTLFGLIFGAVWTY